MRFYTGRKNVVNKNCLFYPKFFEFEVKTFAPFFLSSILPQHAVGCIQFFPCCKNAIYEALTGIVYLFICAKMSKNANCKDFLTKFVIINNHTNHFFAWGDNSSEGKKLQPAWRNICSLTEWKITFWRVEKGYRCKLEQP